MSPQGDERQAREATDRLLRAAGWSVCDADEAKRSAQLRRPTAGHRSFCGQQHLPSNQEFGNSRAV